MSEIKLSVEEYQTEGERSNEVNNNEHNGMNNSINDMSIFSNEIMDYPNINTSIPSLTRSASTKYLKITADYNGNEYEQTLTNFINCQNPLHYFTEDICRGHIICAIQYNKVEHHYDEVADKIMIEINISIFSDKIQIAFELHRNAKKIDMYRELDQLRQITHSDGYRVSHIFDYPEWHTLDDLRKLPHYNYLEIGSGYESKHIHVTEYLCKCNLNAAKKNWNLAEHKIKFIGTHHNQPYALNVRTERFTYRIGSGDYIDDMHLINKTCLSESMYYRRNNYTNTESNINDKFVKERKHDECDIRCFEQHTSRYFDGPNMNAESMNIRFRRFILNYVRGYILMHHRDFLFHDVKVIVTIPTVETRPRIIIKTSARVSDLPISSVHRNIWCNANAYRENSDQDLFAKIRLVNPSKNKVIGFIYEVDVESYITVDFI